MSTVKTFRAASMDDALEIVRNEMGSNAVILESRAVPSRLRFIPWLKRHSTVEITAKRPETASPTQSLRSAAINEPHVTVAERITEDSPVSKAVEIAQELERRTEPHLHAPKPHRCNTPVKQLPTHTSQAQQSLPHLITNPPDIDLPRNELQVVNEKLSAQVSTLQRMLEHLSATPHFHGTDEIPPEFFEIYTQLIDAEIDDQTARELIFKLKLQSEEPSTVNLRDTQSTLNNLIEADVRCSGPIQPTQDHQKTIALVGPTGVGKTTTIAKIAANFRLRDGYTVGLITIDTYRIAAVEQLRTYAEIIDLPIIVVTNAAELTDALQQMQNLDLVLIDTAGRSPRDEMKVNELKTLLSATNIDEVHVVMSLTASVRSIHLACKQFQTLAPSALILTKLDEAPGLGSVLSVSKQVELPISYLTTGQDVPEDIEPAEPERIARLVLGQDRLFA